MSQLRALKPKVASVPKLVLDKAECDLSLAEQLEKARSKIDDSLVPIGQNEMLFAMTTMHQLGSFGRRLTFTPQLALCGQLDRKSVV